ncbi:gluconolaconase [Chryseolinea sp. T2]|uniref:SMP-30/gluconolactonase/LRE family protein n=1 Tax=Chryseolinea sp. T2 TaxID=3129255 RepID=UPI0030784DDB
MKSICKTIALLYSITMLSCFIISEGNAQIKRISFVAPKVYPEGIAIDAKANVAYVSSVRTGSIGVVDAQGKYSEFYSDPGLKSSFGMKVDEKRNLLWVCVGDPNYSRFKSPDTFKKMARIVAFDLSSRKKVKDIDLSGLHEGNHFLNDLAFDNAGNVYITDSFSPVIYKIDTRDKPSVWAMNDLFKSKEVGLNGIAVHPAGVLLVAHNTDGAILRVDMKDPTRVQRVKLAAFFPGADGMSVDSDGNLIVVQNKGVNTVFKLSSTDKWMSAKVTGRTAPEQLLQNPTTLSWNGTELFVLNAKLNELSDSTNKPSDEFSFQKVEFQGK